MVNERIENKTKEKNCSFCKTLEGLGSEGASLLLCKIVDRFNHKCNYKKVPAL